jgi:DNA-binding transcriptional ArsR family regulator
MPDEKITLDREVFRTLASGTRVDIIKSLDRRRKTLSELAKQFNMSVSTIKEHLENLVAVGLIVQMDEGHKWKYYELTRKGRGILHPEDKRVWILLGVSALAFIAIGLDLAKNFFLNMGAYGASARSMAAPAMEEGILAADAAAKAAEAASPLALPQLSQLFALPYLHIVGFAACAILMAVSLLYIRKARKNVRL